MDGAWQITHTQDAYNGINPLMHHRNPEIDPEHNGDRDQGADRTFRGDIDVHVLAVKWR